MMTYTYKKAGFAGAITLAMGMAFAGTANAATVTLLADSTNLAGNTADAFASDYGAVARQGQSWSPGDPTWVVPPSSEGGISLSPFENTSLEGSRNYYSVIGDGAPGDGGGAASPQTLTFSAAQSALKILWGSIDSYNSITFSDGTNTDTVSGADLGLGTSGDHVALVNISDFTDDGVAFNFTTATFASTGGSNAFEFALPVPLPAAGWLMIAGLGGLFSLRRAPRG
jgi:hypothetical protein